MSFYFFLSYHMNPASKSWPASVPRRVLFPAVRSGARTAQIGRAVVFLQKNPRTLVESTRSPGLLFCCAAHLPPARPSLLPSPKLTLAAAQAGARGGDVSSSARRPRWRRRSRRILRGGGASARRRREARRRAAAQGAARATAAACALGRGSP